MSKNESKIDLTIVTPVHNKAPYFKAYLASLLEQDIWDRMEVVCVENGSTDGSWETMNKEVNKLNPKTREHIKLVQIKKANACIARNEGFKHATGRYVSFLPADAFLFPGMARIWVESLDEYPEYGFIYGGYRLAPPHGGVYQSEKWDFDMIKQYNYIDGSFPFKRELFPEWNNGGWDPDIPSLQDWDFWLAIILGKDHKGTGIKGLFRPDIHFETIPPQPGGLSEDSHKNWVERNTQIKSKWGIPESNICVTSPGAPFHAKNIAKILGAEFRAAPQFKPNKFEMIYELGYYPQLAQACSAVFATNDGKMFNGKKVIHWVGSDIWGMLNTSWLNIKNLRTVFENNSFIHLVEMEQTRLELEELGIEARVVPLPPLKLYDVMPFPKQFNVAVYMPETNQEFYYPKLMEDVAEALPDIEFSFFGNQFKQQKIKNIQYMGYIDDMEKFIADCSAIVRLTVHDGMPLSLAEFVMAGRNALFNIKLPHMMFVNSSSVDLIAQKIRDLKKLPLNVEGSKYYRELMDHEKYKKTITDLLKITPYQPKEYWEKRANHWEKLAKHDDLPNKEQLDELLKDLDYNSVLDVGSGNGRWFNYFKGKDYTGIEISERLVEIAKEHYPEAEFIATKLEDYEPDKKFDLAFSYTCLQHIKPKEIEAAVKHLKGMSKYTVIIETRSVQKPINDTGYFIHDFKDGDPINITPDYQNVYEYEKYFNIVKTVEAKEEPTLRILLAKNE